MILLPKLREWALSFPNTNEAPHFDKTSFRVKGKIFVTYDSKHHRASVKLSLTYQDLFGLHDKTAVYPVPNAWGKQGWTYVELKKVRKEVLRDMVKAAYQEILGEEMIP